MALMNEHEHKWLTVPEWPITKDYGVRVFESDLKLYEL
jgi:hypothetical protein